MFPVISDKEFILTNKCLVSAKRSHIVNPSNSYPTKWSDTLIQFDCFCRQIVRVCLTILWNWRLTLMWVGLLGFVLRWGEGVKLPPV